MTVLSYIESLFFPPFCVSCEELTDMEEYICPECGKVWSAWLSKPCPQCGLMASLCRCMPRNMKSFRDGKIVSAFFYDSKDKACIANHLIYALKRKHYRRTIRFLAKTLAAAVTSAFRADGLSVREYVVTYPPRSAASVRKYGYDHTKILARMLAEELGITVEAVIRRRGNEVQKKLDVNDRLHNAANAYTLKDPGAVKGKKFLLLDDVITSGATLGVCKILIRNAGAEDVYLCSVAKDI